MSMKEAYEKKLEAQLNEWSAQIDKLKAQAELAEADAQIQYQKQVKELRAMQDEAEQKLRELQKSSDTAWQDLKAGMDNA